MAAYLSSLVLLHLRSSQDCLDLITSNTTLAQLGLTRQLHTAVMVELECRQLRDIEATYDMIFWFRGINATLQYAWDFFLDTFAVSKQPLTEVSALCHQAARCMAAWSLG